MNLGRGMEVSSVGLMDYRPELMRLGRGVVYYYKLIINKIMKIDLRYEKKKKKYENHEFSSFPKTEKD